MDWKIVLVGPSDGQLEFSYDGLMSAIPSVVHYPSGDEALLNLSEDSPDVLVIDMDSSKVDASRLCKTIKANKKFADLPIVLISGGTICDRSLYFQGVDFIKKPFNTTELLAKLNVHITLRKMCSKLKPYLKGA